MELLLVANFKSHKSTAEVISWIDTVGKFLVENPGEETVVVCPQFTALTDAQVAIEQKEYGKYIRLSAQNLSAKGEGAFTGEVSARALVGMVSYVLIGHSERRTNFGETKKDVLEKAYEARQHDLQPIICVTEETVDEAATYRDQPMVFAYEPPSAIGTGTPQDVATITRMVSTIIDKAGSGARVLYGGSVNGSYIADLLTVPAISGFLVGTASLEAQSFISLINAIREHTR